MPAEGGSAAAHLPEQPLPSGGVEPVRHPCVVRQRPRPIAASAMTLFQVDVAGSNGTVEQLPYGPARAIAFGPDGQVVLGRNTGEPAQWKRYRGGTAGHLWIDPDGSGQFGRLLPDLVGNITAPIWSDTESGSRIYFVSDHEGVGNLYSVRPDGGDLQRHTDHADYYVRNPNSDGRRIVYHAGADLFVYDVCRRH